jgi:hypothetical protein
MGDMTFSAGGNRSFSAEQLFDGESEYSRMHASMKPEAKMRGFFHYLAVLQKAKLARSRPVAIAATKLNSVSLVVAAGNPDEALDADCTLELAPGFGGQSRLVATCRLADRPMRPPAGSPCRALLLTRGMMERLCGAESTRSDESARKALSRLLAGRGDGDAFETARILAAVPEMDGEMDGSGFCRFRYFEVPEQAGHVDELPERTMLVVVIGKPRG